MVKSGYVHTQFRYLREWQPHCITELKPVHFQDSQTHSWKKLRCVNTTRMNWTVQRERHASVVHKCISTCVLRVFVCSFGNIQTQIQTTGALVVCSMCDSSCCQLKKISWLNSQLNWTLVVSKLIRLFRVTVAVVTGKEYRLDSSCTFIQTKFKTLLLLC